MDTDEQAIQMFYTIFNKQGFSFVLRTSAWFMQTDYLIMLVNGLKKLPQTSF